MRLIIYICLMIMLNAATVVSGPADVESVEISKVGAGTYHFRVTVRHADEGWDHYADRWEVMTPDGKVLATRILHHPHVDEQPFTRELAGVSIPSAITEVDVRAHDSVHGFSGVTQKVHLPGR
jgi:hypothetical protein